MPPATPTPSLFAPLADPSAVERLRQWLQDRPLPAPTRWLPMPVTSASDRLTYSEWAEYRNLRDKQHASDPTYLYRWKRPSDATADAVWNLLTRRLYRLDPKPKAPAWQVWDGRWQPWCGPFPDPEDETLAPDALEDMERTTKLAALVAILHAVNCGRSGRMLTQTGLFQELARYFSDHYREARERADHRRRAVAINDLLPATFEGTRRDLVRNQVSLPRLWFLITQLVPGQFADDDRLYGIVLAKKKSGGYSITCDPTSKALSEFDLITRDPNCRRPSYKARVCPAVEPVPATPIPWDTCGERAHNVVEIGDRTRRLLDGLGRQQLLLSTNAVLGYFYEALRLMTRASATLLRKHGIYTKSLSRLDFQGRLRQALKQNPAAPREEVAALLKQHDRMDQFITAYSGVRRELLMHGGAWGSADIFKDNLIGRDTPLPIHTSWYKVLNRRYQATSLWPLSVTGKRLLRGLPAELADAEIDTPVRSRWFRVPGVPEIADGEPQPLVGVDVVASQYQIFAALLDSAPLAAAAFKPGFRGELIRLALPWVDLTAYPGGVADGRLKELVKKINMVSGYDATTRETVRNLLNDQETYGPGFSDGGVLTPERLRAAVSKADHYLETTPGYSDIAKFKAACRRIADIAYNGSGEFLPPDHPFRHADKYRGVAFTDPFDDSTIRWNPPQRARVVLRSGQVRLSYRPPGRYVENAGGRRARAELQQAWAAAAVQGIKGAGTPEMVLAWGRMLNKKAWDRYWKKTKRANRGRWTEFRQSDPHPITGDWPIDSGKLRRMIAPCLIHVTDGLFSSLVLEELLRRGIFATGYHDAWSVGARVSDGGAERDGLEVLREVIEKAGREWLFALEPVYDFLLAYLGDDTKTMPESTQTFGEYARDLKARWVARIGRQDWPRFHVEEAKAAPTLEVERT